MASESEGWDASQPTRAPPLGDFPFLPYMNLQGKSKQEPKVSLRKINIHGNWRTRNSTIEDEFENLRPISEMTPNELNKNVFESLQSLKLLDIFEKVEIEQREVSPKEFLSSPSEKASINSTGNSQVRDTSTEDKSNIKYIDLEVHVTEKERLNKLDMGGESVTNDYVPAGKISGMLKNVFGYAEEIQGKYQSHRFGDSLIEISMFKPRLYKTKQSLRLSLQKNNISAEQISSYNSDIQEVRGKISDQTNTHSLEYSFSLRDLIPRRHPKVPYAMDCSLSVLKDKGKSIKSSLKHSFSARNILTDIDDFYYDNTYLEKVKLNITSELSGLSLGGDIHNFKEECEFRYVKESSLYHTDIVANVGYILNLDFLNRQLSSFLGEFTNYYSQSKMQTNIPRKELNYVNIQDRFKTGDRIRGFKAGGIGPRASPSEGGCKVGDYLGGDLNFGVRSTIRFPWIGQYFNVPLLPHTFLDFGNCLELEKVLLALKGQSFHQQNSTITMKPDKIDSVFSTLVHDSRCVIGAGLSIPMGGQGSLELNYTYPLRQKVGQDVSTRFQFSFSMPF